VNGKYAKAMLPASVSTKLAQRGCRSVKVVIVRYVHGIWVLKQEYTIVKRPVFESRAFEYRIEKAKRERKAA
jgi:hypothetical protein